MNYKIEVTYDKVADAILPAINNSAATGKSFTLNARKRYPGGIGGP